MCPSLFYWTHSHVWSNLKHAVQTNYSVHNVIKKTNCVTWFKLYGFMLHNISRGSHVWSPDLDFSFINKWYLELCTNCLFGQRVKRLPVWNVMMQIITDHDSSRNLEFPYARKYVVFMWYIIVYDVSQLSVEKSFGVMWRIMICTVTSHRGIWDCMVQVY